MSISDVDRERFGDSMAQAIRQELGLELSPERAQRIAMRFLHDHLEHVQAGFTLGHPGEFDDRLVEYVERSLNDQLWREAQGHYPRKAVDIHRDHGDWITRMHASMYLLVI